MKEDRDKSIDGLTMDGDLFLVLINAEGQHSLWPGAKPVPDGWTCAHPAATRADALAYVEANWTDMRPISLRRAMDHGREEG